MNISIDMREVSFEQIYQSLYSLGIKPGDGVLVHSAIQFLGMPKNGVADYAQAFFECLGVKLGDNAASFGTLAVPTFNFDFAKGQPYDAKKTPSKGMGVFSEYIRKLPQTVRTRHPMQSFALVGKKAVEIAQYATPGAFDEGSAFEQMVRQNFKLVLLGADIQAVSAVHYSEQRFNVPYRYWKEFSGKVKFDNHWETNTFRMFVRDLNINPQLIFAPIQNLLIKKGLWAERSLNYGKISLCFLKDFIQACNELLAENVNILMG